MPNTKWITAHNQSRSSTTRKIAKTTDEIPTIIATEFKIFIQNIRASVNEGSSAGLQHTG
jgi:hypothetical protein|tara:strand:- start:5 stop:184 length:180 start_codon:yes stop_codon:yes gene_type:complete